MSILARHRVLSVRDLWPDETEPVDFVAHALRLIIGDPQLADERAIVREMIREAARPQVSQHLHWLDVPPEELAAYLILRRFVADVGLQNPSNQLSGLQIFSPETNLLDLEPLALGVASALSADTQVWAAVNTLAETFLTPRRLQKVMGLLPTVDQQPESFAAAARRHGMAPVLLKQHLRTVLLSFFAQPAEVSLAWVPQLVDHPAMVGPVDALSPRALECRVQHLCVPTLRRSYADHAAPSGWSRNTSGVWWNRSIQAPRQGGCMGNVLVEFALQAQTNLGEELVSHRGQLGARASYPARIAVLGTYRQTPARELDPAGTITAVTVRLRHTDLQGNWRDAIDGVVTVPVNVRAKKTRLDTEALKGFDDI